jgi:O-antigen ligase
MVATSNGAIAPAGVILAGFALLVFIYLALLNHVALLVGLFILLVPLTRESSRHNLIANGMTALFLLLYFSRKILLRQLAFLRPPQLLSMAVLFYLLTVLLSSVFSSYPYAGFEQLVREVGFFVVVYAFYDWLRNARKWQLAAQALQWIGIITSASVLASLLIYGYSPGARFSGVFLSSTSAGLAITVTFPIALSTLREQVHAHKPHARAKLGAFLLMSLVASVLTVSRITIFVVLVSYFLVYIRFALRNWRFFAALLALAAICLLTFLIVLNYWGPFVQYLRLHRGLSGRGYLWERGWAVFLEHPLLGTGPSTFRYYALPPEYMERYGSAAQILALHAQGQLTRAEYLIPGLFGGVIGNSAHNMILDVLSTNGIIGLLSVLALLAAILRIGMRRLKALSSLREGMAYAVAKGCLVSIVGHLITVQFMGSGGILRGSISAGLPFWLCVVLLASNAPMVEPAASSLAGQRAQEG